MSGMCNYTTGLTVCPFRSIPFFPHVVIDIRGRDPAMSRQNVSLGIRFPTRAKPAHGARERFLARVRAKVHNQIFPERRLEGTHLTRKFSLQRLLSPIFGAP